MSMDEAPRIGQIVEIGGITLTRQVDPIQLSIQPEISLVSRSLSRNHPDAPAIDKDGKPCFSSKKQVDEFVAKQEGDIVWD